MGTGLYLTPTRLTTLTFFVLILLGTALLMLPMATAGPESASFIDALFTATSAVCVTGLVVQDTATYFSPFGQGVILALIQLGGFGIMTLYAAIPILFGRQMKLSHRATFGELFDTDNYRGLRRILVHIVQYTFLIESVGALLLTLKFFLLWGDFWKALYFGVFHAVSAFCNAGFMLFTGGFNKFRGDGAINLVIMILIILGGMGFVTLQEFFQKKSFRKLSSYSKLVLTAIVVLILIPSFLVFHIEYLHAFSGMDFSDKVLASFFQVVAARTAGFNTVDISGLHMTTLFLFCLLMFIGAAPGGTGGGTKTTTVGILFLSLKSIFKGQGDIECFHKRVPSQIVTKAIAVIAVGFSIVTVFVLLLSLTETASFLEILFETVSAFGTVGFSMGLTPKLSLTGKFLVSLTMFIGRIGSLTLVFVLGSKIGSATRRYTEGKFFVG